MRKLYKVIYENGVFRPLEPMDFLEEGKVYQLEILSEEASVQYREAHNLDTDDDKARIMILHV